MDGNERLGWLACAVFLELDYVDVTAASNDEVYDLVMWVAAGTEDMDAIAERLRQLV
ncbi:MAG: hypothetical protein R3324_00670 [Halobacteriales archaeon]|nr:hypothetical protein [Halobacteriales archaeon]